MDIWSYREPRTTLHESGKFQGRSPHGSSYSNLLLISLVQPPLSLANTTNPPTTHAAMSSPFIKRAKGRSNIRSRDDTPSSPLAGPSVTAADDEDESGGMSPMQMAKNRRKDKNRGIKSKLSFGGDDEGEEDKPFVPRKSNLSQSISLQKLAATPSSDYHNPFASTSAAASSSSYTSSYLDELKASTPSRISRRPAHEDDPVRMDVDSDEHPTNSQYADTTQGIPDEALIAAAKAKRKAAYGQTSGEDYISLTEQSGKLTVYDGDEKGPHPESRLQREEDELGEGDEGEYVPMLAMFGYSCNVQYP